jgi:uncharacterized protein (DUF2147 family)
MLNANIFHSSVNVAPLRITVVTLAVLLSFSVSAKAQISDMLGEWRTVDDQSGEIRASVRIYKDSTDGLYYGQIVKLYKYPNAVCDKCEDKNKNKPVLGMIIITGMKADNNALKGGKVLDPGSGKWYYSSLSMDKKTGKLVVRGSLDKRGLLGRNQYWIK